jgi:hypothetical protein
MLVDLDEREVDALCEHYLQQMEQSAEKILEAEETPPGALGPLKIITANACHKIYINAVIRVNTMRHIQRGEPFVDAAEVLAQDLAARRAHRASLLAMELERQQTMQTNRVAGTRLQRRKWAKQAASYIAGVLGAVLIAAAIGYAGNLLNDPASFGRTPVKTPTGIMTGTTSTGVHWSVQQ